MNESTPPPGDTPPQTGGLPPAPRPPPPPSTVTGDVPPIGKRSEPSATQWQTPPPPEPPPAPETPAANTRWKPLRGGLINLFKYRDQVFEYADGHLLLRGDNGCGKSRVLALQLPFLLDGELNPRRVEPDRDPAKKVEWNLLMDRYENRLGYTWIEFHRIADGEAQYLTLGCGLHARKGSDLKRWFFITAQRVRHDLHLIRDKTSLTERQLKDHFEEAGEGEVYKKASLYRNAIDQHLFKLGGRYRPLIDLLIQLRQPQLMRDMKEDVLSKALSEALAPIDEALVNQVAESFQGLEGDRQRTAEYSATLDSVESFREAYTQYLATAIRRLCEVVRLSHSRFEAATKEARKVEHTLDELRTVISRDQESLTTTRTTLAGLEAEIQTLQASPEMRGKRDLDAALQAAERAGAAATAAARQLQRTQESHQQAKAEHDRRDTERGTALAELQSEARDLRRDHAAIAPRNDTTLSFQDAGGWEDADAPPLHVLREGLREMTSRRLRSVRQLETRNHELREALSQLERARDHVARTREQAAEASATAETRLAERDEGIAEFGRGVRAWEASLEVLSPAAFPLQQPWQEDMDAWLENQGIDEDSSGDQVESPFDAALRSARDLIADALSARRANAEQRQLEVAAERATVEDELAALRDDRHSAGPLAPPTRAERDPSRPGAPLWKLIDFQDAVPAAERPGWEAALQAAGLLDAWVLPDGRFADPEAPGAGLANDDFLLSEVPHFPLLPEDKSLAAIFHAEASAPVSAEVVSALLRRLGNHAASATCWIASDGHWANGPRRGHWHKAHIEFVGHRAREDARQRRIAKCEADLADLTRRAAELAAELDALVTQREGLTNEMAAAPKTQGLLSLAARLNAARERVRETRRHLGEAEENETVASQAWQESRDQRDADARDLHLVEVAKPETLAAFKDMLAAFQERATAFWPVWEDYRRAGRELALAHERLTRAVAEMQRHEAEEEQAREESTRTRSRADTLQATLGADIKKVMTLLVAAKSSQSQSEQARNRLDRAIRDSELEEATLKERRNATVEKRDEATGERLRAIGRMEVFAEHRLFEEVDPTCQPDRETFSASAAVNLARQLEKQLKEFPVDDAHWNNLQSEFLTHYQEFAAQIGSQGHMSRIDTIDESGVNVVRCEHDGLRSLYAFGRILHDELQSRQRFFEEREREVIENHLIGEAAHALQRRIRDGEEWVRIVNAELEHAHTSSGIRLQFKWRVADSADADLPELRKLFLRSSAAWLPEERERIAAFLQARIEAARESEENATWRDYLRQALDYRVWHRFGIELKKEGDTNWKRLTKQTFGTGSGGEKAVTLTVPQFAAAAAHYQSADKCAPRLILLDEVFAGIDAPTRGRLMGLLETFDLDYVMTSQIEWGVYPTVSALAIYHLASRKASAAVAVTRWLWNGHEKLEVPEERSLGGAASVNGPAPVAP